MCARTGIVSLVMIAQLFLSGERILIAQSAMPLRVEFTPGSHMTTVQGSLRGRQQMNYVIAARKDQRLTLRVAGVSGRALKVKLWSPKDTEIPLDSLGANRWTAIISETGDYEIWVMRVSGKPGVSPYRLTIAIPGD